MKISVLFLSFFLINCSLQSATNDTQVDAKNLIHATLQKNFTAVMRSELFVKDNPQHPACYVALCIAAMHNDITTLGFLLQRRINQNQTVSYKVAETILSNIIQSSEIFKNLQQKNLKTPLALAIEHNNFNAVQILIENKAQNKKDFVVTTKTDQRITTLLLKHKFMKSLESSDFNDDFSDFTCLLTPCDLACILLVSGMTLGMIINC